MCSRHLMLRAFKSFMAFLLLAVVIVTNPIPVCASAKAVPIPPKRPDVMSASPAYIRELMGQGDDLFLDENFYEEEFEAQMEDFSDNPSSVELTFIEPEVAGTYSDTPVRQQIIQSQNNEREKALVSFTLTPEQISLDPNLSGFLLEHAVGMIKNDPEVRLEIHAYASKEKRQQYSDVRRSLARALEVRSFLLEQNIDPSRLKIMPMGQDIDNTIDDRIDLLFIR